MSRLSRFVTTGFFSRRNWVLGSSLGLLTAGVVKQAASRELFTIGTAEDRIAIQDLNFRHAFALDSLDAPALEACWIPGSISREQIDKAIEYHRQYTHTMHNVHNYSYKIHKNEASGVAYCVASMVKAHGDRLTKFDIYFQYRDELIKRNEQWFFAKRALEIAFSTEAVPVTLGAPLLGVSFPPGSFRNKPDPQGSTP